MILYDIIANWGDISWPETTDATHFRMFDSYAYPPRSHTSITSPNPCSLRVVATATSHVPPPVRILLSHERCPKASSLQRASGCWIGTPSRIPVIFFGGSLARVFSN